LFASCLLTLGYQSFATEPIFTGTKNEPPPRIIRTCCSFGADVEMAGMPFIKISDITSREAIGNHVYMGDKQEGNGIIYTKRGGFIDLGHLRDCADWTAYLYHQIVNKNITEDFELTLGNEAGRKVLIIPAFKPGSIPNSYELASKIAYDLSLWHEIATWYGASYIPMVPERYSSFSPEDLYSNLLGTYLGKKALQSNLPYNEAMTFYIAEMLDSLQSVETYEETYAAMDKVMNVWWTDEERLPSKKVLLMRYFDCSDNVCLEPWTVEPIDNIFSILKPSQDLSNYYSLSINLNYKVPNKSGVRSDGSKVISQFDFDRLINYAEYEIWLMEEKDKQVKHVQLKKNERLTN
jgi:hypothetical protein